MAARISKVISTRQIREGGGFLVRRPIGDNAMPNVDPFLMLDHMGPSTYKPGEAVGAPDHPHRGFETVTMAIEGSMQHLDSSGSKGTLKAGGVQWMTAGRGVVHAEMPSDDIMKNGGTLEGFQLWVNLPKKLKMTEPRYQDYQPENIPIVSLEDGISIVRVIGGEFRGIRSPIELRLHVIVLDVRLHSSGNLSLVIPKGMNSMIYCYRGSGLVDKTHVDMGKGVAFEFNESKDQTFTMKADSAKELHALFLAGVPLNEPIAKYGPFVMNTQEEIEQAISDYRKGKLGGRIAGEEERRRQTESALDAQRKNGAE